MLDTKECSHDKFYPSKQPDHQKEAIQKANSMGHTAGFVVWFKIQDPAGTNLRLITNLDTPSTIQDGNRFDWITLL